MLLVKNTTVSFCCQFVENLVGVVNGKKLKQPLNLIIFIESAMGMLNLPDICRKANELTELGAPFQLDGIVFGSDDFCASIGTYDDVRAEVFIIFGCWTEWSCTTFFEMSSRLAISMLGSRVLQLWFRFYWHLWKLIGGIEQ